MKKNLSKTSLSMLIASVIAIAFLVLCAFLHAPLLTLVRLGVYSIIFIIDVGIFSEQSKLLKSLDEQKSSLTLRLIRRSPRKIVRRLKLPIRRYDKDLIKFNGKGNFYAVDSNKGNLLSIYFVPYEVNSFRLFVDKDFMSNGKLITRIPISRFIKDFELLDLWTSYNFKEQILSALFHIFIYFFQMQLCLQ